MGLRHPVVCYFFVFVCSFWIFYITFLRPSRLAERRDLFVMLCGVLFCESLFSVVYVLGTGWRRPTGCLNFIAHFPPKTPIINGSFAENDLQLKASYGSSPPCIDLVFISWTVLCSTTSAARSDVLHLV